MLQKSDTFTQVLLDKKISEPPTKGGWKFTTLWIPTTEVKMGREIMDGWKITEIYGTISGVTVKKYPKDFKTKLS